MCTAHKPQGVRGEGVRIALAIAEKYIFFHIYLRDFVDPRFPLIIFIIQGVSLGYLSCGDEPVLFAYSPNTHGYRISLISLRFERTVFTYILRRPSEVGGGGYLFPCSPEINWLVPMFPRNKKKMFSMFPVPQYCLCSPVRLKIWPLFPCSPEINALVPLFPKAPGRASLSFLRADDRIDHYQTRRMQWLLPYAG